MAHRAVELIREVLPGTIEMLDMSANLVAYGSDRIYNGLICGITLQKAHINIMFAQGADLPDPQGLLIGTSKKARHFKTANVKDLMNPAIRSFLQSALEARRQAL